MWRATQCSHYERTSSSSKKGPQSIWKKAVIRKRRTIKVKAIQDGKMERQQEAQKLEQRRLNLFETEKELMKSEKHKDSELQTAKTLYEETNERLMQAILNKNFNEVAVAQGFLEVAKKKMENATD